MTVTLTPRNLVVFGAGLAIAVAAMFAFQSLRAGADGVESSEATFVPINPCRLLDTRPGGDNVGNKSSPVGPNETYTAQVTGTNGNCDIPSNATGAAMNVTAVSPTAPSYLQLWPSDEAQPLGSNLNYLPGQAPTPNKVDVKLSADGKVSIFNAFGSVDVIADVVGYYAHSGLQFLDDRASGYSSGPVTATLGATIDAARLAAPELPLFSEGTLDIYAKCLYDPATTTVTGEMYVRTTADGAMLEGDDDLPGTGDGATFLDTTTAETERQLDSQSSTTANTASYNEAEGLMTSAEGRMYHALTSIGVKQGSPAGGNGPFGEGTVCMFHVGLNG